MVVELLYSCTLIPDSEKWDYSTHQLDRLNVIQPMRKIRWQTLQFNILSVISLMSVGCLDIGTRARALDVHLRDGLDHEHVLLLHILL